MINILISIGDISLQLIIILLIIPFFSWLESNTEAWVAGESIGRLREYYDSFIVFFREACTHIFSSKESLLFSIVSSILLILSGFSCTSLDHADFLNKTLADPLLVGGMLIVACLFLMPVFYPLRHGITIFVMVMVELLLALSAPGVNGLVSVHNFVQASSGSGLAGTSICCAGALALVNPVPHKKNFQLFMIHEDCFSISEKRRLIILLDLLRSCWILMLGNLLLPVLMEEHGIFGLISLFIRFCAGLGLLTLVRLAGVLHRLKLVALLMGIGLLVALAGRFAT